MTLERRIRRTYTAVQRDFLTEAVAHAYLADELLLKFWDAATLAEHVRALTLLDSSTRSTEGRTLM
jgi:hypothetical protein